MDDKVQELASKIYNDGIAKADSQAKQIIAEAEKKRDEILAEAKREAEEIARKAESRVTELRDRSERELRLSASRAAEALRTEITDMINTKAVSQGVESAFADPEKLYEVVLKLCEKLVDKDANSVTISTGDAKALKEYFADHAAKAVRKGVEVKGVAGSDATFVISPEEQGYAIVISKEALTEYFKEFMRPQLRELLFAKETEGETVAAPEAGAEDETGAEA